MKWMYLSPAFLVCYANDNDALIPEIWAQSGLMLVEENMVAANLVHRDFEDEVANFGDVVNTRRPGTAKIRRKKDGVTLVQQDAVATNVRVPLDQWFYSSFTIKDGEASLSFQDLIQIHLLPHAQNMARSIDRAVLGRITAFLANKVGRLSSLDETNAKMFALEAREKLNVNKVPPENRWLLLSPSSETAFLKTDIFLKANERGDGGTALENALLGRILGFQTYMGQNVNSLATGAETAAGTVTDAQPAGEGGSQTVSIVGYEANVGEFATVAGNNQPTIITAKTSGAGDTTAVTFDESNKYATLAAAVITVYKAADVKGAFAAGHIEEVVIDGFAASTGPQVGQIIAFGTGVTRHTYTVIETIATTSTEYKVWLDRPLEIALADNDLAFPGPYGSINWAGYRDALALVTRPLALPDQSLGVKAGIGTHNNLSMRVLMQYDLNAGGTIVNLDMLAGTAVLDSTFAVPLLG